MADNQQKNNLRGVDISRPMDHIELAGETYPLAFDLASMRVAEDVYELQYGRNLNFADIVRQLAAGKLGAVMAVLYGALLSGIKAEGQQAESGHKPMTWGDFSDKFKLTSIPGVRELLMKNVQAALPIAEGGPENP